VRPVNFINLKIELPGVSLRYLTGLLTPVWALELRLAGFLLGRLSLS
jgi:hypothetical protein